MIGFIGFWVKIDGIIVVFIFVFILFREVIFLFFCIYLEILLLCDVVCVGGFGGMWGF